MKKYLSFILISALLFCLTACRKMPDNDSSSAEVSVIENIVYVKPAAEDQSAPQSTPKVLKSTIETPDYVHFYNGGKYGTSTDKNHNHEIAKHIEAWFKEYNTPPTADMTVDYDLITDITCNETAIELIFYNNNSQINLLGTFNLERANRLLIPITGEYKYYVFVGYDGKYRDNPYNLNGSGLEKYFDGVTFDKKAQDWQSTVIAPTTVTFYKGGMQSVSTDKELNLKVAQHIETWYKYQTTFMSCCCISTNKNINERKRKETAVELIFDDEIKFYGGFMSEDERKIFISIDGDHAYEIFSTDLYSDTWGNMSAFGGTKNLEPFFEGRQFEEIPMDEWQSAIMPPYRVQLYKNGKLLEELNDEAETHKIAQEIESWYIYEKSIDSSDSGMTADTITNIRRNETYIEIFFNSEIKFYDKSMLSPETRSLLIPLTGDYAYCMFEANKDCNYNRFNFPEDSTNLEQFFDSLTVDNNNS